MSRLWDRAQFMGTDRGPSEGSLHVLIGLEDLHSTRTTAS